SGSLRGSRGKHQRPEMAERFGEHRLGCLRAVGPRRDDEPDPAAADQLSAARPRPVRRAIRGDRTHFAMRLKKTTKRSHGTMHELNITPLIDLVFVLLVIFIITTPQLMNNLELALPWGKTDSPNPAEPARIRVAGRNEIQLDSRSLTRDELKTALAMRKAAQPDLSVIVEGTDTANYQ